MPRPEAAGLRPGRRSAKLRVRGTRRDVGERAPHAEPVIDGDAVGGDRHEAGQPRLGGQEIVVRIVELARVGMVADGEQLTLLVVEKTEVHLQRKTLRALREIGQPRGQ